MKSNKNDNCAEAKSLFEEGISYMQSSNFIDAEKKFLKSLEIVPDRISTISNLIQIYFVQELKEELERFLNKYDHLKSEVEIKFGYAYLDYFNKKYDISLKQCFEILNDQNDIDTIKLYDLIASNYLRTKKFLYAIRYYKLILKKEKSYLIFYNIGALLSEIGKTKKALKFYEKSKELNPFFSSCLWNMSQCYLKEGNLEKGFELYENRFNNKRPVKKQFQDIPSVTTLNQIYKKKILIWDEQGLGDTINFSRFVIDMLKISTDVTFAINSKLVSLLKNLHKNINVVDASSINLNKELYDYQIPLCSLPKLLNLRYKKDIKFYKLNYSKKDISLPKDKINIGFTWFGNPNYPADEYRSIPFKFFQKVLNIPNTCYFKLSKNLKTQDLFEYHQYKVQDLGENNFFDIANYMLNLDLIISPDTVIAHLAGILNIKCLLLLNFNSDWRWFYDNSTTVWYPSIKIIKQKKINDWQPVFDELETLISNFSHKKL